MKGLPLRVAALLASVLAACAGTDVGNPPGSSPGPFAVVTLRFTGSAPTGQGLTLASGHTVDDAWVVVDRIRLRTTDACEGAPSGPDDVPGPVAVELIGGTVLPATPTFEVAATAFCRLEIDLDPLTEGAIAGAPAELEGNSVMIRGSRRDGVRYIIRGAIDPRFELDARSMPFSLAEGDRELVVRFDYESWVDAAQLDEAEIDEDGSGMILIDRDHNHDRLQELESAVGDGTELYCDDDHGSKQQCASGKPEPEDGENGAGGSGAGGSGGGGGGGAGGGGGG